MKTKRNFLGFLLAALIFAYWALWAFWEKSPAVEAGGFGHPIHGAYFCRVTSDAVSFAVPSIVILHRDGTTVSTDASDFGFGSGFSNQNSPASGAWERIGKRRFAATSIVVNFDNPDETALHGAPNSISKLTARGIQSRNGRRLTARVREEIFDYALGDSIPDVLAGRGRPGDEAEVSCERIRATN